MPNNSERAELTASELLAARMVRAALCGFDNLELHAGTALECAGLVSNGSSGPLTDNLLAILLNPRHLHRRSSEAGPVLFYVEESGSEKQYAIELDTLLLNEDVRLRTMAYEHFAALAESIRSGPAILETMGDHIAALKELNAASWKVAGLAIADALSANIDIQLRGLAQSLSVNYEEGVRQYLSQLLKATLNYAKGCDAIFLPSASEKELDAKLELIVSGRSALEACDEYIELMGFAPLGGRHAFSSMIDRLITRGSSFTLEELRDWSIVRGPLARFHVAAYALSIADENSGLSKVAGMCFHEMLATFADSEGTSSDGELFWKIAHELARYYLRHFELLNPAASRELLANYSWWLSVRVAEVLSKNVEIASRLQQVAIRHFITQVEIGWRIAKPPFAMESLSAFSHWGASPWIIGLLRGRHVERLGRHNKTASVAMMWWPNVSSGARRETYLCDGDTLTVWDSMLAASSEEDSKAVIAGLRDSYLNLSSPENLIEGLRGFASLDEGAQLILANGIKSHAFAFTLPLSEVWSLIGDHCWANETWGRLSLTSLEMFSDALLWSIERGGDTWIAGLPHVFANATVELVEDDERAFTLFGLTLFACSHSYSTGALQKLRVRPREAMTEIARTWHSQLGPRGFAPYYWVISRTRSLRAELSAFS